MGKQLELVMVTENNNNKYYRMIENDNGTWTAKWGRVGATENVMEYSMDQWEKKYREKIKKGYKDITSIKAEVTSKGFKDIKDSAIKSFLDTLHRYSKHGISENYTVSSEAVTQAQIDLAQDILNRLSSIAQTKFDIYDADELLKELYTTIPRKMKNVKDYLLIDVSGANKKLNAIIDREQDSIDNMASQVSIQSQNKSDKIMTLEEALGIKIEHTTGEDVEVIKKLLGKNSHQFLKAFAVTNINTRKKFEDHKDKSFKFFSRLLWHGSRNENWLSILSKGLMIRPTGVVITGAMFGNGVYFANKAQKSIGYTSLSGSYWARGNDSKAYLALFEVNTGNELRTQKHEYWMGSLNEKKLKEKGDYDSLYAKGGIDLINDEFIIYNQNQSTIKYIVEIKNN